MAAVKGFWSKITPSLLSFRNGKDQNSGSGTQIWRLHSCGICYHIRWDHSHFDKCELKIFMKFWITSTVWVQAQTKSETCSCFVNLSFQNSCFLPGVILNGVNLLLRENCSQNQTIYFFLIYPLGVTREICTLPFSILMNQYLWSFCRRCNWLGRCAATGKQIKIVRLPFKACSENNGGFTR